MELVFKFFIIVLVLTVSFGPGFFTLINTSIRYGFKFGAYFAIGVVLSDLLLSVLVTFLFSIGAANFIEDEQNKAYFGLISGIALIVFGIVFFMKKEKQIDGGLVLINPSPIFLVTKGFFLNLLNPAVWALWLTNISTIGPDFGYSFPKIILFFIAILLSVLSVELYKAYLADKIKKYLTLRFMNIINNVTGLALVIGGIYFIYAYWYK